jgi:hypothetical protein
VARSRTGSTQHNKAHRRRGAWRARAASEQPRARELPDAARELAPLAARVLAYRELLPEELGWRRTAAARRLRAERTELLERLRGWLDAYLQKSGEGSCVAPFVAIVEALLAACPLASGETARALTVLPLGLKLADKAAPQYLALLASRIAPTLEASRSQEGRLERERFFCQLRVASDQILALLRNGCPPEVAAQLLALGLSPRQSQTPLPDPALYRLLLALWRRLSGEDRELLDALFNLLRRYRSAEKARGQLNPIVHGLAAAPKALRAGLFSGMADTLVQLPYDIRATLPRLRRYLPIVARGAYWQADGCQRWHFAAGLLLLDRRDPVLAEELLGWTLARMAEIEGQGSWVCCLRFEAATLLAAALCEGDAARYRAIFEAASARPLGYDTDELEGGLRLLGRAPGLRSLLGERFAGQPLRCATLLVRLSYALRLGPGLAAPLLAFADTPALPPVWEALLAETPALRDSALAYLRACRARGEADGLPQGVARALALPERLARELAFLEGRLAANRGQPSLEARARSLRLRLGDPARLHAQAAAEAAERLAAIAGEAELAALEQLTSRCYRAWLSWVSGQPLAPATAGAAPEEANRAAPGAAGGVELTEATQMALSIRDNRRLLRRLLYAELAGQANWREQIPANAAFLASLAARGVDVACWLSERPRELPDLAGGRIFLEQRPLHVLRMGTLFGTCLSLGEFNAYSAVTNACELNKRVIFVADRAGEVIGRKLIAISTEGRLVGFHTYCKTEGEADAVQRAVQAYAHEFAAACGLELADQGEVATLFAQGWYDDGAVAWGVQDQRSARGTNSSALPEALTGISGSPSRAKVRTASWQQEGLASSSS